MIRKPRRKPHRFSELEDVELVKSPERALNDVRVTILRTTGSSLVYEDVLAVRCVAWGVSRAAAVLSSDSRSEHYCAYLGGEPVAAIRVTRAAEDSLTRDEAFDLCVAKNPHSAIEIGRLLEEACRARFITTVSSSIW